MTIRRNLCLLFALFTTIFAAVLVSGQTASNTGEGTYKINGKTTKLESATLAFKDHNEFELTLGTGDHDHISLGGRYSGNGHHRDLKVRHGLKRDAAEGAGEVVIGDNGRTVRSLTIHGEVRGDSFTISFKDTRKSDDHEDDRHSFSDHVTGIGELVVGSHTRNLKNLRVNMARNGDLTLHVEGPDLDDTTFEGRWTGDGPSYEIDLRHSGHYTVHSTGTLELSKNRRAFKTFRVTGKENGERMTLHFDAN